MDIVIKQLAKKDFNHARKFAIKGMHLDWYTNNKVELYLYSKYFWSLEIDKATNAYGAYLGDKLVGVLLADMVKAKQLFPSWQRKVFIKFSQWIVGKFYGKMSGQYDQVNIEMLAEYQKTHIIDGELNFFAVDPNILGKGLGTQLLERFNTEESGKSIYLYTDSGSTYQFYFHRGFSIAGQREVTLEKGDKIVPLTCYLLTKTLG